MKKLNVKKLVLSTAIISASSLVFAGAGNTDATKNYDAPQSQSQSVTAPAPADRNITNPNTGEYSNSSSTMGDDTQSERTMSSAEVDVEVDVDETVRFEPNSVTLTESAEMQLEKVVEQIDKDKPVALTVEIQGSMMEEDLTSTQSSTSSATVMNQDSSAGFPADDRGVAGARLSPTERGEAGIPANSTRPTVNTEAVQAEQQDRAQLISRYRAENIRQYLERQGITVVQWELEGGVTQAAGGTSDTGFVSGNKAEISAAEQRGEEIQQVRIVVVGDVRPDGLSAL